MDELDDEHDEEIEVDREEEDDGGIMIVVGTTAPIVVEAAG